MAVTVEGKILRALASRIDSLSLGLPVALPNANFTPPEDKKYLAVHFIPTTTQRMEITSGGAHRYIGLLQVDVVWPQGLGQVSPMDVAGAIIVHFPCDLILREEDVSVRISKRPEAAGLLDENDQIRIPVSIEYECYH